MARRMTRVAASIGSSVNLPKPEIGLAVDRHTHTLSLSSACVCVYFFALSFTSPRTQPPNDVSNTPSELMEGNIRSILDRL
jgi:hypothetical protein